jgi:hypothetical protein
MEIKSMPTLYERIQSALSSPNGRVMVATYTKATLYTPKHKALFVAPKRTDDLGVYVKHGTRVEYVFPDYVKIGHLRF